MTGLRILAVLLLLAAIAGGAEPALPAAWRKPSAAVVIDDGKRLAVANEGTGTISLVRLAEEGAGPGRMV